MPHPGNNHQDSAERQSLGNFEEMSFYRSSSSWTLHKGLGFVPRGFPADVWELCLPWLTGFSMHPAACEAFKELWLQILAQGTKASCFSQQA